MLQCGSIIGEGNSRAKRCICAHFTGNCVVLSLYSVIAACLAKVRMMKKSVLMCMLVVSVSAGLTSSAKAVLIDANETAWMRLDDGEAVTCIAHYIPDIAGITDTLIFTAAPDFIDDPAYLGDYSQWDTMLVAGGKAVYLYGPRSANESGFDNVDWFTYRLFFQWDDSSLGDPDHPVYIDTAYFDGDFGSSSFDEWFAKGEPGNSGSWEYDWDSSYAGPYTNPVPEPATVLMLGLGMALLVKKRQKRTNF